MKHVLGFSGGADSQAAALWLRRRFPPEDVVLTNCDPGGNEHPITVEFVAWYSAHVHPVHVIHPIVADMIGREPGQVAALGLAPTDPLTFERMVEIKGYFPSTKLRFCTTHLKVEPMRRWCYAHGARGLNEPRRRRDGSWWRPYGDAPDVPGILSDGYERYAGVRRDESAARSDVDEREFDDYFMCWLNRPLAAWTKADVFAALAEAGEDYNPLYRLGFARVGCAPCVNSNKEDILLWATRFPEMIAKVRAWEAGAGRNFFGAVIPTGKGKRRSAGVDRVVEWAKTTRGGVQMGLPILEADVASGMCMSKWGLCE